MKDGLVMNESDRQRLRVMSLLAAGSLTQAEAAEKLGLSTRQVRRLAGAYAQHGDHGLIHKARGKPSNNRTPQTTKEEVLALVSRHYFDFGPTFAQEKLQEDHDIKVSVTALRNWMIDAHIILPPNRKTRRIYARRARRSCFGELIQIDGSYHLWFENRGVVCCLIVAIDDATGRLCMARFVEHESLRAYFEVVELYLKKYGAPLAFYTDRFSVFTNNNPGEKKHALTQFGRALNELGIEHIAASTPQAKGRVERANRTLQNRLIKEMRLKNISSIEDGNRFLARYIEVYNSKYSKAPASTFNAHQQVDLDLNLKRILCPHYVRKVAKDLTISVGGKSYQLDLSKGGHLQGQKVVVIMRRDDSFEVFFGSEVIRIIPLDQVTAIEPRTLTPEEILARTQKPRGGKPGKHHSWKRWHPKMNLNESATRAQPILDQVV